MCIWDVPVLLSDIILRSVQQ